METTYWIIGDNVRRLRMENRLTQEELAEKALLSPKGIQKVEAGRSGMYVETFIRIASALDVSLDILADMGKMGRQQRAQMEAFYMISHGKAWRNTDAVEVVRAMFRLKSSYLDRG